MDSLLANYASSDDEGEAEKISHHIPPPKSSLFSSLPPPKSQFPTHSLQDYKTSSSSTFSSLPAPKSHSGNPSNKKVVHFTLPLNPSMFKSQEFDEDDEEEDKGRKNRKDDSSNSTPKVLSSLLPAPKNTLCIAPAQSLGASRRSSLQTDAPSVNYPQELKAKQEAASFANHSKYCADQSMVAGYENCGSYSAEQGISDHGNDDRICDGGALNPVAISSFDSTYASIPTEWEQDNGKSFGYTNYIDNWSNVSSGAATSEICDIERIAGKRGRADIPIEIMEVKQDELMKNRPREDQVKLTGIAFGPAYQPVPSAKGKPSKLQKRKHQIGSLYYDLKQKEMELAERRSKGLLTKSETQAKYGW